MIYYNARIITSDEIYIIIVYSCMFKISLSIMAIIAGCTCTLYNQMPLSIS